jgi:hypothetical protein
MTGEDLPIVAVIEGDPIEAGDCVAAGADEILRRPVTVASLARTLTAVARRTVGRTNRAVA